MLTKLLELRNIFATLGLPVFIRDWKIATLQGILLLKTVKIA